jgi:hypothetical protein
MSTGCQCWYHLRGLLKKPKKPHDVMVLVLVPLTRFAYETKKNLAMWYEHRLSVLVPLTRFTYKKKTKNLVMWSQHRLLVLVPLMRFTYEKKTKTS